MELKELLLRELSGFDFTKYIAANLCSKFSSLNYNKYYEFEDKATDIIAEQVLAPIPEEAVSLKGYNGLAYRIVDALSSEFPSSNFSRKKADAIATARNLIHEFEEKSVLSN